MALTFSEPIGVLLVEDNPIDARVVESVIGSAHFVVDIRLAKDGLEALNILRGEGQKPFRPDVILLDLSLPKLRGIDVINALAKDPGLSTIPVVVLTGSEDRDDVLLEARQQVHRYLRKPVDRLELIAIVREIENRARLNRFRNLSAKGAPASLPSGSDRTDSALPGPRQNDTGPPS